MTKWRVGDRAYLKEQQDIGPVEVIEAFGGYVRLRFDDGSAGQFVWDENDLCDLSALHQAVREATRQEDS